MSQKVWLVTGCSSGFGLEFIKAIIKRGDKAIATARRLDAIKHLEDLGAATLQLDVTAGPEVLAEKVQRAVAVFGHVDVVVYNAGFAQLGGFEDITYDLLSAQFETNVFGVMGLTHAIMPHFRERQSGSNVLISSVAAVGSAPGMGAYSASKAAIEALYRSLALEVQPLGIKTLILEPGVFRTEIQDPKRNYFPPTKHNEQLMNGYKSFLEHGYGKVDGDPAKLANLAIELVRGEGIAEGKEVPLALPVGPDAYGYLRQRVEVDSKTLEHWAGAMQETNFDGGVDVMKVDFSDL